MRISASAWGSRGTWCTGRDLERTVVDGQVEGQAVGGAFSLSRPEEEPAIRRATSGSGAHAREDRSRRPQASCRFSFREYLREPLRVGFRDEPGARSAQTLLEDGLAGTRAAAQGIRPRAGSRP